MQSCKIPGIIVARCKNAGKRQSMLKNALFYAPITDFGDYILNCLFVYDFYSINQLNKNPFCTLNVPCRGIIEEHLDLHSPHLFAPTTTILHKPR